MTVPTRWLAVALVLAAVPRAAVGEAGDAPLLDDKTLIALAVALACSDAPDGRAPAEEPRRDGPEVELVSTVRATAIRFDEIPQVDVVLRAGAKRRTSWRAERVNLPARPEPGVVYRDVQVRLAITSDLDELTALLREAKRASRGVRIERDGPQAGATAPASAPVTAPDGLLAQGVNAAGQTVQRIVDTGGRIIERTLDGAGGLAGERVLGSVLDLPVVSATTDASGRAVRTVRDGSGTLLQLVLDAAGGLAGFGILGAPPAPVPVAPAR